MPENPRSDRIWLALDVSPRSRAALEMAAALAAEQDAELVGLFVEDVDLLRLSGLPFARDLGQFSGGPRPIVVQEVEHALRREAGEAQRRLAEAAERMKLRWSFHVARGSLATELFARAGEFDLVVLGQCARLGLRLAGGLLAESEPRPRTARPVVAVCDNSAAAHRALELSGRLARARGVELQVLVTPVAAEACPGAVATARACLAQAGLAASAYRCVEPGQIGALTKAVREARAGVLVLDGGGRFRSREGFATLLNEIDCPVILVG